MAKSPSQYKTLDYQADGPVARVTLNRPEVHNAFNGAMVEELIQVFGACAAEKYVRIIILGGNGKSFCAGADLKWMSAVIQYSYEENLRESNRISDLMDMINSCPKVTIARVQGAALGGGAGLSSACDFVMAAEEAFFSLSEVRIGLVPACISPYVIARLGPARAREYFISGERISGSRAAQTGLATEAVPASDLDRRIEERTREIMKSGPEAIIKAKELVARVPGMARAEAKTYTAEMIAALRVSPEGQEGMDAFLKQRQPKWVNK
jgi:methylglutaconyl-CoA hydratase